MLFNLIYSVALRRVADCLEKKGVVLKGAASSGWKWGSDDGETLVETAFVDDGALMLAARTPAALVSGYRLSLGVLCRTFPELGFTINWKENKT